MNMNKFTINSNTLALGFALSAVASLGFAFSNGALAESLSKNDYKAGKENIAVEYKLAKANCAPLAGNPKDICLAEAKGKERVGLAELEASYKPSAKSHYEALVAKAEATYAVANEKCDDLAGNVKDVCVKEAKAAETTAKADAKAQLKTSAAKTTAKEKAKDARKDATADKLDAQYKVAKEKCDDMAGNVKDACLNDAKAKYEKP
jgi:hypothetical protein